MSMLNTCRYLLFLYETTYDQLNYFWYSGIEGLHYRNIHFNNPKAYVERSFFFKLNFRQLLPECKMINLEW